MVNTTWSTFTVYLSLGPKALVITLWKNQCLFSNTDKHVWDLRCLLEHSSVLILWMLWNSFLTATRFVAWDWLTPFSWVVSKPFLTWTPISKTFLSTHTIYMYFFISYVHVLLNSQYFLSAPHSITPLWRTPLLTWWSKELKQLQCFVWQNDLDFFLTVLQKTVGCTNL